MTSWVYTAGRLRKIARLGPVEMFKKLLHEWRERASLLLRSQRR